MPDGKPLVITFNQNAHLVTGHGSLDGNPVSLSALVGLNGPALIVFNEGNMASAWMTLSPDGESATVQLRGNKISLKRGSISGYHASGDFSGSFQATGFPSFKLTLSQIDNLIAGTGLINGRAVAIAGKKTDHKYADCSLLFSDESCTKIAVILSEDSRSIQVKGLGNNVNLRRTGS